MILNAIYFYPLLPIFMYFVPGGTTQETPKYLIIKYFGVSLFSVKQEVTYKVTYGLRG